MGKKHKVRKKLNYTKTQFIGIICNQCGICQSPDPVFCYEDIYKSNQISFINKTYPLMTKLHQHKISKIGYIDGNDYSDSDLEELFEKCFCETNSCGENKNGKCSHITGCISVFRKQFIETVKMDQPKVKKTNKTYIPEAYPTFFCSDGVRKEIENPQKDNLKVPYEDNIEQCNNCNECTCKFERFNYKQIEISESNFCGS